MRENEDKKMKRRSKMIEDQRWKSKQGKERCEKSERFKKQKKIEIRFLNKKLKQKRKLSGNAITKQNQRNFQPTFRAKGGVLKVF